MLRLTGIKLPELPVDDLKWVSDLEYFEGPLVSHFSHKRGDHYLKYWVDRGDDAERWMLVRVSENNILRLANRFESLDTVIPLRCQDDFVYFIDESPKGVKAVVLIAIVDVPDAYTPSTGALLRPERPGNDKTFPIMIETGLSMEELSGIPRAFKQAYSVLYLLKSPKPGSFYSHPWRGGYSSMHFYQEVEEVVPVKAKADVNKMQYASPGFIKFDVHRPTADFVRHCIAIVADKKTGARTAYTALGSYIKQHDLNNLGLTSSKWAAHDKELLKLTKRLLMTLDIQDPGNLFSAAPRPFEAAKIARSIFKRLSTLARYEKDGLIRLPLS